MQLFFTEHRTTVFMMRCSNWFALLYKSTKFNASLLDFIHKLCYFQNSKSIHY